MKEGYLLFLFAYTMSVTGWAIYTAADGTWLMVLGVADGAVWFGVMVLTAYPGIFKKPDTPI